MMKTKSLTKSFIGIIFSNSDLFWEIGGTITKIVITFARPIKSYIVKENHVSFAVRQTDKHTVRIEVQIYTI